MNWIKSTSSFNRDGTPVTRTRFKFNTIFGEFAVGEKLNGSLFMRHPFIKNPNIFMGYDNGTSDWYPLPSKPISSIEEGKNKCEEILNKLKEVVNSY